MSHPLVISALNLRRTIGFIGIGLPIALWIGAILLGACTTYQESVSIYYHTVVRNLFVGALCAVAYFLLVYRGEEPIDNRISSAAGIMALGIVFFPTNPAPEEHNDCIRELVEVKSWSSIVHFSCAGLFFLLITYLCFRLFTKTNKPTPTPEKLKRNTVYRVCSYVMLACVVILVVYFQTPWLQFLTPYRPVFIFETIALWAFGIAWITKGEFILKDHPNTP